MVVTDRMKPVPPGVRTLNNGDRMSADEFHRIYMDTPDEFRAELVGGIVYVASPLSVEHGTHDAFLGGILTNYAGVTTGLQVAHAATVRLGESGEPQPDLLVRILPEYGGQSSTDKSYIAGAPELVAEIARSSWAIDLGSKYDDYRRYGVREYVVLDLHSRALRWFDLTADKELAPDADGIIRARQFPGLWLKVAAILAGDFPAMRATLDQGMASREYAEFVAKLAAARV